MAFWFVILASGCLVAEAARVNRVHNRHSTESLLAQSLEKTVSENVVSGVPSLEKYAFVVKYKMEEQYGVEIAHTAMLACDAQSAYVQNVVKKFDDWCDGRWWSRCFFASPWVDSKKCVGDMCVQQPVDLTKEGCTEYEFASDVGIQEVPYGQSNYYHSFTELNATSTKIYPVGKVSSDQIKDALEVAKGCGKQDGLLLDYNPNTYHFLEHNCHSFTNLMLHLLNLPYFKPGTGLPDRMMPAHKGKNPILGRIVNKVAKWNQGDAIGKFQLSKKCSVR